MSLSLVPPTVPPGVAADAPRVLEIAAIQRFSPSEAPRSTREPRSRDEGREGLCTNDIESVLSIAAAPALPATLGADSRR